MRNEPGTVIVSTVGPPLIGSPGDDEKDAGTPTASMQEVFGPDHCAPRASHSASICSAQLNGGLSQSQHAPVGRHSTASKSGRPLSLMVRLKSPVWPPKP